MRGPLRAELLAAASQLERYARAQTTAAAQARVQEDAQALSSALAGLAQDAERAEANVTRLIRAGVGKQLVDGIRERVDTLSSRV